MKAREAAAAIIALFVLSACDESQVLHRMHPTLERMMDQRRGDPYAENPTFDDGRAMRAPPEGTFARDSEEPPYLRDGKFTDRIPYPVTRPMLERGRTQFDIVCAACHGVMGDSHSVVAEKMELRPPPSLHIDRIRSLSVGEIDEVIENGYGLMPSYMTQLPDPETRWAVVAYVRALQLSQRAVVATLPPDMQARLAREAP